MSGTENHGRRPGEPAAGPDASTERAAADSPTQLGGRSWKSVLRRTGKEFKEDELTDRAAALTY